MEENGLIFRSFASGSSGNCYYLGTRQQGILIDAGISARQIQKCLREMDLDFQNIMGVLITHDHADHIGSAGKLSSFLNVNVYVSKLVFDNIAVSYHRYHVDKDKLTIIKAGETFSLGKFMITPFVIPHDASDNFGYKIINDDEVFTVMTDIGKPTKDVAEHIRNSNYLVIEADYDPYMLAVNPRYDKMLKNRITSGMGHLSNDQTAMMLYDNFHENLRFVSLCHLSQENNKPDLAKSIVLNKLKERNITENSNFRIEVLRRNQLSGPWVLK